MFFGIEMDCFWVNAGGGGGDGLRDERGRDEQDAEGDRLTTKFLRSEDFLIIFKPFLIYL